MECQSLACLYMSITSAIFHSIFLKRGEPDFRFLAEVVQAVQELQVPSSNLRHKALKAGCDGLPEVVQLTHSENIRQENDVQVSEEMQESSSNVHQEEINQSAAQSAPEPDFAAEINVRDAINQLTCKICFSAVVGIIFLPCGHLVCCVSCAPAMVDCPICRKTVNGTVQAFMP